MSRVIGAARLARKLDRLPDEIKGDIIQVLRARAEEVAAQMRAAAPVSAVPTHGGHMRDRIGVRYSRGGLRAKVGVFAARGVVVFTFRRAGRKHSVKTSTARYARFLEFGTRKMGARPFVLPSWRQKREALRRDVREAVARALRAASGTAAEGDD